LYRGGAPTARGDFSRFGAGPGSAGLPTTGVWMTVGRMSAMADSVLCMLVSRTGLSPVMVGRGMELARLERLLQRTGDPQVALVGGEAGVGKTRLVQELLTGLPDGAVVLAGQAEQYGPGRPYGLLLEAVAPFVAGWTRPPEPLAAREQALRLLLAPVAPGLAAGAPEAPAGEPDAAAGPFPPERTFPSEALLRGAVDLVRHLVTPGPGVLVFEDLHWADPESLSLFGRLASTPGLPVLLVGSYRTEAIGHRLTDLLAGLERRRSVEHVVLERLRRGEVSELLGAVYRRPVPATVAHALHRRTAGNPFFLEELLVAAGDAPPEELPSLPLPANLTEALLLHLDGLDPEQRRVVDAAAVLGQRIPFDLLAAVTGSGEAELIAVLRALVGRGLIVEEDADIFSFRHALTREAVAGRLLGRERRRLHEKALACLRELGSDDWSALAHHAAGAGRWEETAEAARAGARQYLRTGSTFQALQLAELALAEAEPDVELLELAVRAAWSAGLREQAAERAERWRELAAAAGQDADLARALRHLARLRWELGQIEAHRRAAKEALAVAERLEPSEEQVLVFNMIAESEYLASRPESAIEWADRALALAGEVGASGARGAILVNKGSALMELPDRWEEGVALLEQALREAEEADNQGDWLALLRTYNNLTVTMEMVWPVERVRDLVNRMAATAERSGRYDWLAYVEEVRASILLEADGDLIGAREIMDRQQMSEGDLSSPQAFWAAVTSAELALEAGDTQEAARLIARARSSPLASSDPERRVASMAAEVRLALRTGRREESARLLRGMADLLSRDEVARARGFVTLFRTLREALRGGVDPDEVRRVRDLLAPAGRLEGAPPNYVDPAWAPHLEGAALEADGEPERALAAYREAMVERSRRREPVAVADVHQGMARCLLALRRYDQAREHAEAAVRLLDRWPGWRRAEAEALLRRLSAGSEAGGPEALTPREREVAALLTAGLSNGEVARRLYISPKTASVHVSNILTKLGMSSRAEIAAWAVREGLEQP
jgi:DNA-binding CsgD family transcriptional regulator